MDGVVLEILGDSRNECDRIQWQGSLPNLQDRIVLAPPTWLMQIDPSELMNPCQGFQQVF